METYRFTTDGTPKAVIDNCCVGRANTGGASGQSQRNSSEQEQLQFVPIAPQVNLQNVNLLTHGDVTQGDANNANTGQANQQENRQVTFWSGGHPESKPDGKPRDCKPRESKPKRCEPKRCEPKCDERND